WYFNFKTKLPVHASTLGLSMAEVNSAKQDCEIGEAAIKAVIQIIADKEELVKWKNILIEGPPGTPLGESPVPSLIPVPAVAAGINIRLRKLVQQIKLKNSYNISIGEDLKIIGAEQSIDIASSKPQLIVSKAPSGWQFDFNLKGFFDGVNMYRKRPDAAAFSFLALDTATPYIDTDTQVNGTEYYAFYVLGETEVGLQSAIEKVQV
ncbi:MAG: hypothetical protein AABZ32_10180, partial [Bacteroidota bacterium]